MQGRGATILALLGFMHGPLQILIEARAVTRPSVPAIARSHQILPRDEDEIVWVGMPKIEWGKLTDAEVIPGEVYGVTADSHVEQKLGSKMLYVKAGTTERLKPEVDAYKKLQGTSIAPNFLALVTQNKKVVAFVLQYIEADRATRNDEDKCRKVLDALHEKGLVHGDVHSDQFLIDKDGKALLLDYANSKLLPEEKKGADEMIKADNDKFRIAFLNTEMYGYR
ncbi:Uu.00g051240.m01.CDS01 [Anthostomella pinea]|uniref:Uu.00g051240.m01.CDS01 n=1 Tax=Anthostomella pinea TaxID=933095 RepID=A0AAI8VSR5_9PEZI|nr:Uu.00g051240.m01.CDS01 [Anthostomella pinea]